MLFSDWKWLLSIFNFFVGHLWYDISTLVYFCRWSPVPDFANTFTDFILKPNREWKFNFKWILLFFVLSILWPKLIFILLTFKIKSIFFEIYTCFIYLKNWLYSISVWKWIKVFYFWNINKENKFLKLIKVVKLDVWNYIYSIWSLLLSIFEIILFFILLILKVKSTFIYCRTYFRSVYFPRWVFYAELTFYFFCKQPSLKIN
jgi:hypothetical protein